MSKLNKEIFIKNYKKYLTKEPIYTNFLSVSLHKYLSYFLKPQELHLKMFGSRRYGYEKENSDFDFFVEYHPFLEESLIADGWAPVKKDVDGYDYSYSRTNVFSVLEMDFQEYGLPKIQLVFVKDFYLEEFLWDYIDKKEYWEHICKHNPEFRGKTYVNNYINAKIDSYFHFCALVTSGFIKQRSSDIPQPFAPVQAIEINEPLFGFQVMGDVGVVQANVIPEW